MFKFLKIRMLLFYALCFYVKYIPLEKGKWRLIKILLPWSRKIGKYLGIKKIKTQHGFYMKLDMKDWLAQNVYVTGEYESSTSRLIQDLLNPGDCFIDIGANVGYFSLLAATVVGNKGKVIGFEPVTKIRNIFYENLQLNPNLNIVIEPYALSNQNQTTKIFIGPDNHLGISSLRCLQNFDREQEVHLKTLDSLNLDLHIDVVKIDVEGYEKKVLEGMNNIIQKYAPDIICEITPSFLKEVDDSMSEIFQLAKNHRYNIFIIKYHGIEKIENENNLPSQFNALFTRKNLKGV